MAVTPRMRDDKKAEGQEGRGPNTPEKTKTPDTTGPDTPLGARTPRGHETKAKAPTEGSPAGTCLAHQAERHTQTPATRTQRAAQHLTAPSGDQPAT